MADVQLGDNLYNNVAVVRMNAPDGTIVDFYESNYYDIDLTDLRNIFEDNYNYQEYNINLSKQQFDTIMEQRLIPRIKISRVENELCYVVLNEIIKIIKEEQIKWVAQGNLEIQEDGTPICLNISESLEEQLVLKIYRGFNSSVTKNEESAPVDILLEAYGINVMGMFMGGGGNQTFNVPYGFWDIIDKANGDVRFVTNAGNLVYMTPTVKVDTSLGWGVFGFTLVLENAGRIVKADIVLSRSSPNGDKDVVKVIMKVA